MPINLTMLQQAVQEFIPRVQRDRQARGDCIALALEGIRRAAQNQGELIQRVEQLTDHIDRMIRCACPTTEPLADQYAPLETPKRALLIASDGSQISPSWHDSTPTSLVNNSGVIWYYGPDQETTPEVIIETKLLLEDELLDGEDGLQSEAGTAQYRDIRERELLAELAARCQQPGVPTLALGDFPLELWGSRVPGNQAVYHKNLQRSKAAYAALQADVVYTAGYVESRVTRLLVRMLEIALEPENDDIRHTRPLAGLTDSVLMEAILKPGHRSAVFRMQTRAAGVFSGPLRVHFFFLNVSMQTARPHVVRIEIPAWMASNPQAVNLTQAMILEQCRIMPAAVPYPYILFRADASARVTRSDEEQVRLLIRQAYLDAGLDIPLETPKRASKRLT